MNSIKQGCICTLVFYIMVFLAMLTDAFHDYWDGMLVRYRINGGLFNPRHLKAVTKVKETIVRDFLLAL